MPGLRHSGCSCLLFTYACLLQMRPGDWFNVADQYEQATVETYDYYRDALSHLAGTPAMHAMPTMPTMPTMPARPYIIEGHERS